MSYQVGWACFATLQDAGTAACTQFAPVTSFTGGGQNISTASCLYSGADGTLQLKISTAPITGGVPVVTSVALPAAYQQCLYPDFVDAGLLIFVALLTVWATTYGMRKIISFLNWSRGDEK
jgi:hypothetical protein